MVAKRDLFAELVEGFDALKGQREAQIPLDNACVEATSATLEPQHNASATAKLSGHQQDSAPNAKQTG